jgi:hypothetical protein
MTGVEYSVSICETIRPPTIEMPSGFRNSCERQIPLLGRRRERAPGTMEQSRDLFS